MTACASTPASWRPARAIVTAIAAVAPPAILGARGASGLDVYGWRGSLATYGFIVTDARVCVALPRYLRDHGAAGTAPRFSRSRMHRDALRLRRQSLSRPRRPYAKIPYICFALSRALGMLSVFRFLSPQTRAACLALLHPRTRRQIENDSSQSKFPFPDFHKHSR